MTKPWALIWILTLKDISQQEADDMRPVLDTHLQNVASRYGMALEPLEGEEHERLQAFEKISEADQIAIAKYIVELMESEDEEDDKFEQFILDYLDRDVNAIMADNWYDEVSDEGNKIINDEFLVERNRRMVDRALPLMANGGFVFIAVGLAHLPGKGGMLEMFEQAGYKLTPVY